MELVELWSELGAGVDLLLIVLSTFTSCLVLGSMILIGFLFLCLLSVLLGWETGGGCDTGAGGAWWNDCGWGWGVVEGGGPDVAMLTTGPRGGC